MRDWFLVWRREIDVSMRTEDLLDAFPGDPDITDGGYTISAVQSNRVFRTRYEWSVLKSGNGGFRVTEHAYIGWTWYLMLAISLIGVCLGYIGTEAFRGMLALVSFFTTFLLTVLFVVLFVVFGGLESPVDGLFKRGKNHTYLSPLASLTLTLLPLLFLVLAFDGFPRVLGVFGVVTSIGVYAQFQSWVVDQSFRWQSWLVSRTKQLPLIAANYIASICLGGVILGIFLATHDTQLFLTFSSRWPIAFPLIYAIVIFLLVGLIGRTLFSAWSFETERFQTKGRNIDTSEAVVVTTIFVVAASLGFGYLSYRFLVEAGSLVMVRPSLGVSSYALLSGIPVWYFATGLVYQVYRFFSGVVYLLRKSERRDLGHILDVDAETYVFDYEGIYAGAVSLRDDYIVVSQGILDSLPGEEVEAILAHEEGHLKQRDTVIGVLITVFSPLVLTAKNVLYGVLDFRSREFQADQYAASRVEDRQQVFDALDSLQRLKAEGAADSVPSVTPTLLSFDSEQDTDTSFLTQLFGFYFGEFAMSQVHPSLAERKDRFR